MPGAEGLGWPSQASSTVVAAKAPFCSPQIPLGCRPPSPVWPPGSPLCWLSSTRWRTHQEADMTHRSRKPSAPMPRDIVAIIQTAAQAVKKNKPSAASLITALEKRFREVPAEKRRDFLTMIKTWRYELDYRKATRAPRTASDSNTPPNNSAKPKIAGRTTKKQPSAVRRPKEKKGKCHDCRCTGTAAKLTNKSGRHLCPDCHRRRLKPPICTRCAKPYKRSKKVPGRRLCWRCRSQSSSPFIRVVSAERTPLTTIPRLPSMSALPDVSFAVTTCERHLRGRRCRVRPAVPASRCTDRGRFPSADVRRRRLILCLPARGGPPARSPRR